MADFIIPLVATGNGTGVSTLSVTVSSNTTMSIDGNGMFYDNAAGTINGSTTRSITAGGSRTFFLKVASGNCNITVVDGGTKVIRFVEWTSSTNASSIYQMNLSSLPSVLQHFYCIGSNTISGKISSLPPALTYFHCRGDNTISGNISSLPPALTYIYCGGFNTITGDIGSLSSGLVQFNCLGSNTVYGNLNSLPPLMTYFQCGGSNTITGNLASLSPAMGYFYCTGDNTITGDLSSLPSIITYFYCGGRGTISGNLSSLPSGLGVFICIGSNIVSGNLSSMPAVMNTFVCSGNNSITGNLSSLPSTLTWFTCTGPNNTISGDLSSLPLAMTFFQCTGKNTVNSYTSGKTFSANMNYFYFNPTSEAPTTANLADIVGGSGDCSGNSGVTFTPSQTQYYKHIGGGTCYFKDSMKWFSNPGLTTQGRVPLPQDDWFGLASSFNATTTFVVDRVRIGRSMDLSGVNQVVIFSLANSIECYGSYGLGNTVTQNGDYSLTFCGRGLYNFNTFGKNLYSLRIEAVNGTYTCQNNIIVSREIILLRGTLDFNDFNVTAFNLYSSANLDISTIVLYLGNGVITLTINTAGVIWRIYPNNILYTEGSTINLIGLTDAGNVVFIGGSKVFNKVQFSGSHTGNFDITGNNTFAELIIDKGRKVRLTGGSNQTVTKITALGTIAEPITISSTNTAQATLTQTGTGYQQLQRAIISYITALPANKWYAGDKSTNAGNNIGWLFRNYRTLSTIIIKKLIRKYN